MLVSPILDLFDFLMIFVFGKQTIHFGGPDDSWLVSAFAHGVTWIIAVVLVTPQFRELLGPIEELCLDLINYVPSIPLTDRSPVIRFILGGRRGPEEGSLEEELPLRLQDLLKTVVRRHGGRVLLIGHSLGSIIALRALQEPATKVDESDNCDYDVNLVTMGSPLEFLTEAYPNTYPEKFVLKSTSTWENLFTSGDVIGRCLDKSIWTNGNLDNTYVGPGGHVGYFDDPAVASRLATRFG